MVKDQLKVTAKLVDNYIFCVFFADLGGDGPFLVSYSFKIIAWVSNGVAVPGALSLGSNQNITVSVFVN